MEGNLVSKLSLVLVAACLAGAAAQPLGCTADYQCDGYCDKEAKLCRECLKCEDFKRSPPGTPSDCIRTVLDCGACIEGLVENVQGDLYAQCTPDDAGWPASSVWAAIAVAVVLIVGVVGVVLWRLLRHTDIRILTSTDTSVQSGCANGAAPSAPERPPAYNSLYTERPGSPPGLPHFTDEEAERPFLKQNPLSPFDRESAENQAANFYNNPNYVRGPHLPSNYHTPEREPETTPEYLQDETTAESPWTPDNNNADADSSTSGGPSTTTPTTPTTPTTTTPTTTTPATSLSAALAAELARPPPCKQPRLRQDTNNNRNNRDSEEESMSRPFSRPTINISVNVQQLNDVKL